MIQHMFRSTKKFYTRSNMVRVFSKIVILKKETMANE